MERIFCIMGPLYIIKNSKGDLEFFIIRKYRENWSGRRDLNSRPLVPETSALARLRYAPTYPSDEGRVGFCLEFSANAIDFLIYQQFSPIHLPASSAAWHPKPAAVMAWR